MPLHYSPRNVNHPAVQAHTAMIAQSQELSDKYVNALRTVENNISRKFDDLNQRIPMVNVAQTGNSVSAINLSQRDKRKFVDLATKLNVFN